MKICYFNYCFTLLIMVSVMQVKDLDYFSGLLSCCKDIVQLKNRFVEIETIKHKI